MRRRTLVRRSAALGALALAGCATDGDSSNGTNTPPPDGVTGFGDVAVETTDTGCASDDTGSATVGFSDDPLQVTVDGVLRAATPCHVADLEAVTYDPDAGVLEVTIAARDDPSAEGCAQCIGAIGYEATVPLEGDLPPTVVVEHKTGDGTTQVARIDSDSS